jgi:hypothetical protein
MTDVKVVNIIPASHSSEANQDSEPSIAVNPQNPSQIAITAFTPPDPGLLNSPIYYSLDGGFTWHLNFDMPYGQNATGLQFPGDQTIAFSADGNELFGAFLRHDNGNLQVFRTNDVTAPAVLGTFDARPNIDQPWVESRRVLGGPDDGKFRVYVGYNDDGPALGNPTATVDVCLDGLAAAPVYNAVKLNPRPVGAGLRDGYAIRPVAHADGTVYVAYEGWTAGAFGANITTNIVVARDDSWAKGATPFTDLKDPSDNLAGRLVATGVTINDGGFLALERLNNDLAIAVDPRTSSTVYVAWADNNGANYTLRVRRSTDRGVTWSGDLLTVDNATMTSLAINSRGKVGLMYQQVKDSKWETHFRRTTDDSGTNWDDITLAKTPSAAPGRVYSPYLGDWARLVAVGTTFYGVFCANNTPDPANFPSGVRFQRNRSATSPPGLLDNNKAAAVAASIDPFFFRVREGSSAPSPGTSRPGAAGSLLIPSAVALLAHKRLRDVVDALERKLGGGLFDAGPRDISLASIDVGPVTVNPAERRILALAKAAAQMFEAGPAITGAADGLQVGHGIGQFAIAGSSAFELPAYAALFERNGSWIADIIRRGSPDENLSKVVVPSSQFAVRAGEKGIGLTNDDAKQAKIQSFSMGMLSALASDVVVSPVLRGLQIKRTKRDWSRAEPALDIGLAEERIVRDLLGGRDGAAAWQGWWPGAGDIPDELLDGYLQAMEEAYGIAANRPRGFADFEELLAASTPPQLDRDRLRAGYKLARLDAQIVSWGAGTWYLSLLPLMATPVLAFGLTRAMPHGKAFVQSSGNVDERAVWEVLTLGTGLGALPPLGYSIYLATQVPENKEAFIEAIGIGGLRVLLSILSIAEGDASAGVRWGLLYLPLALTDLYGLIRGLIERGGNPPAGFVFLLQTLPVLTGASVLLWGAIARALIATGANDDVVYVVMLILLAVGLFVAAGIPISIALSHGGGLRSLLFGNHLNVTGSLESLTETGGPGALAALFDDSTLWVNPDAPATGPTLADLRYPAGRRALLRIWWTGAGSLQVSHDEHTVTFKLDNGSTKDVVLQPGKLSANDVARLLMAQMPGVQAEIYDPADPENDLPFPHTFADPGDTQGTTALHDAHVHDFAPLGTSVDEAYILRHTPRDELVTGYGETGPSHSNLDAIDVVPDALLGDIEGTALGLAADLAVLLCMGAAPSLAGSANGQGGKAPAEVKGPLTAFTPTGRPAIPGNLDPVFEVFRQWNLDERRVNEWRLLVNGRAERDQTDPVHADPGMRPDTRVAPYVNKAQNAPPAAPAPAPETVATALGWVPLWRAWSRMATDITADTSAQTAMSYTPTIRLPNGTALQPTNFDLTNAMRFLLDLA